MTLTSRDSFFSLQFSFLVLRLRLKLTFLLLPFLLLLFVFAVFSVTDVNIQELYFYPIFRRKKQRRRRDPCRSKAAEVRQLNCLHADLLARVLTSLFLPLPACICRQSKEVKSEKRLKICGCLSVAGVDAGPIKQGVYRDEGPIRNWKQGQRWP